MGVEAQGVGLEIKPCCLGSYVEVSRISPGVFREGLFYNNKTLKSRRNKLEKASINFWAAESRYSWQSTI